MTFDIRHLTLCIKEYLLTYPLKYIMKKHLFVFLSLLLWTKADAQEIYLPSTNYNSHFNTQMITGNFTIPMPLFEVPTASPDLTLTGHLIYNQNMADNMTGQGSGYWNKTFLPLGTELDFIPSINKILYGQEPIDDEVYYNYTNPYTDDPNYIAHPSPSRPLHDNRNIYSFSLFGNNGKFILEEENHTMTVKLLSSSEYVTISPNITFSKTKLTDEKTITEIRHGNTYHITIPAQYNYTLEVHSFTITDSKGLQYVFDIKQRSHFYFSTTNQFYDGDIPNTGIRHKLNEYTKSFLLREVRDRNGNLLLNYTYGSFPDQVTYLTQTQSYDQQYLSEIQIARVGSIALTLNSKKYSNIQLFNLQNTKIKDIDIGYGENILNFYNADRTSGYNYKLHYNPVTNKTTFTLPTGGRTEYEMEKNKASYVMYDIPIPHFPTTSYLYDDHPFSYNSINGRYSFSYSTYDIQNTPLHLYFVGAFQPGLGDGTQTRMSLFASNGTFISYVIPPTDPNGVDIRPILNQFISQTGNSTITGFYMRSSVADNNAVSDVTLKKKLPDPDQPLQREIDGKRLKRVVSYDYEGYNQVIVSEQHYTYKVPGEPLRTSGTITWGTNNDEELSSNYGLPYIPCLYRLVQVASPGMGKTEYTFDLTLSNYSYHFIVTSPLSNIPYEEKVYDEAGHLVSQTTSEVSTHPKLTDYMHEDKVLKKIDRSVTDHRGSQSKTLQTITEWDETHKNMTRQKITDPQLEETFESEHTYINPGGLILPHTVIKRKNNTRLNRSTFEYTSTDHRLKRTLTAKGELPMESDKEITLCDTYGKVLEYTENGRVTSQIWGYDNNYIVAELVHVPYASINTNTINAIRNNSQAQAADTHDLLLGTLNSLRQAHPEGMVTTHTYHPLIGRRTTTDPGGWTQYYEYDAFRRPFRVLNHQQQKEKELRYNLKNNG